MFCYFVNRHSLHFMEILQFLGFNSFWINVFLWLPVKLSLLELRFKYGFLENYLEERKKPNESAQGKHQASSSA